MILCVQKKNPKTLEIYDPNSQYPTPATPKPLFWGVQTIIEMVLMAWPTPF